MNVLLYCSRASESKTAFSPCFHLLAREKPAQNPLPAGARRRGSSLWQKFVERKSRWLRSTLFFPDKSFGNCSVIAFAKSDALCMHVNKNSAGYLDFRHSQDTQLFSTHYAHFRQAARSGKRRPVMSWVGEKTKKLHPRRVHTERESGKRWSTWNSAAFIAPRTFFPPPMCEQNKIIKRKKAKNLKELWKPEKNTELIWFHQITSCTSINQSIDREMDQDYYYGSTIVFCLWLCTQVSHLFFFGKKNLLF